MLPVVMLRILPHHCSAGPDGAQTVRALPDTATTGSSSSRVASGTAQTGQTGPSQITKGGRDRPKGPGRAGPQLLLPLTGRPDLALPAPHLHPASI